MAGKQFIKLHFPANFIMASFLCDIIGLRLLVNSNLGEI